MRVKGSAVETLPLFIKTKFGEDSFQKWLKELSEQARKEYGGFLLATKWYPLKEIFVEPTMIFCKMFYSADPQGAVELGRFSAEQSLKGIYKVFVKLGSPDFIIGRAANILPTFYDDAVMDVTDKGDKKVPIRITKFDNIHELVENRIKGWMEKALDISGAKAPKVFIAKALSKGDRSTDYKVSWE